MRVVAGGALAGNDRLMKHGGLVGDASLIMAFEAQLRHIERQKLLVVVRTVCVVAESAQAGRGREVDVLPGRDVLVMAFVAEVGHGGAEQMSIIGRMRIMATCAFSCNYRFVLVTPQEQRPAVAIIAEVGLFRLEGEDALVRAPRMGRNMAGTTAFLQGSMQHPALAHGLVALVAVLIGGGKNALREQENGGSAEER
jgi:hypothetical protein